MNRPLEGNDSRPWHRQFWPWFLILLPASVVVAGLSTLYIANRHADDLVADEYYKDGLAINRQLEKKQRATQRGISASLNFNSTSVTVNLEGPVTSDVLQLRLSHPLEADRDFIVTLEKKAPGHYTGVLAASIAPRWHWILQEPQAGGWRLDGAVQASDIGHVAID